MLILGYLFIAAGLFILLGWLFPVLSGTVRIRKGTGGKVVHQDTATMDKFVFG